MLVRTRDNAFGIAVFHWRGSALRQIWPLVLLVGVTSLGVDFAYTTFELDEKFSLGLAPFSLIGLALSIFLGFRNNACYDRFWEARKHWGSLVNNSRTFARSVSLYVADHEGLRRELVLRQLAFVHALRMHLRGETDWQVQLAGLLPQAEMDAFSDEPNVPNAITRRLGERLRDAWKDGHVDLFHLPAVEGCVATDTDVQGACERIKNTPLPASYTMLTHRIVGLYCLLLPFGLHTVVGYLTPVVTMFVSYAFFGLDAVGSEIEDPFETDVNDLPLSQLCNVIERDLRRSLGQVDLPPASMPVRGVLQ